MWFTEETGIRVCIQNHIAGLVGYAVVGICSNIIKKLVNCDKGVLHCGGLLIPNGAQCSKEFVVHGPGIVEEGANNPLYLRDTSVVKRWDCIDGGARELFFCAIRNFTMLVWRVYRFCWGWMAIAITDIVDVAGHTCLAGAVSAIPLDVDASKFGTRPIGGDDIGLAECVKEVLGMVFASVLDTEVINN